MTPAEARAFAAQLNALAAQAEDEGRDVAITDLLRFANLDDQARAELAAAIERARD